jgi:hypothetical protein
VSAQIMALKKPATTDRSMDPIRIARPEQSRQEMRQEKERTEKHKESLTKPQLNLTTKKWRYFFVPNKIN